MGFDGFAKPDVVTHSSRSSIYATACKWRFAETLIYTSSWGGGAAAWAGWAWRTSLHCECKTADTGLMHCVAMSVYSQPFIGQYPSTKLYSAVTDRLAVPSVRLHAVGNGAFPVAAGRSGTVCRRHRIFCIPLYVLPPTEDFLFSVSFSDFIL